MIQMSFLQVGGVEVDFHYDRQGNKLRKGDRVTHHRLPSTVEIYVRRLEKSNGESVAICGGQEQFRFLTAHLHLLPETSI